MLGALAGPVGIAAGCGGGGSREETPVMQRQPDTLYLFISPAGSVPLPAPFQQAAALFEQARVDYQQRRFADAARGFLDAARLLRQVVGFHASTAAANRRSCYRNAWAAFSAAAQPEEGRAVLSAEAELDPPLAGAIREMISGP
jgi:hypothetical protein